jgi:UDP-4-amino-4,6-dideoxy-N-acetyl-beta-L-altrosamine transaminase/dTDP-4-dehydrorhamnose reductase
MKDKKRMLITGVSGLLGNNLAYYFRDRYKILGLYHTHPVSIEGIQTQRLDVLSEVDIKRVIHGFKPDVLIHCASLTNIDQCEMDKELTRKVNLLGTRIIVEGINREDSTKLIYISTDSVYDGRKGYFSESDKVNPLSYYGLTKYEGELEVLKRGNSLIFRTNIFGWNIQDKYSLAEWILHELSNNQSIRGFKDVYFSSIYTFEFARILDMAIDKGLTGVYNCGSRTSLSKYEFALCIAERFNLNKSLIKPISIDDFSFKARRGKNLTLNITKLSDDLNHLPPTITESIDAFYKDFKAGLPERIKHTTALKTRHTIIPYGRQSIDEDDIKAVVEVMRSRNLTQGPKIEEFESTLCSITGATFAVAVNSGTSALHIACLAAGVVPGDEVITSPNTFVASANCAVYCGARPVFADIDPYTYNISPEEINKKITSHTKAIIPVHFAGQSCDMGAIQKVVEEGEKRYGYKIYIIEDACHALGSQYKGNNVGSCTFSDMAVMSFHPVKHITTGEGGAILTNDEALYKKLKRLRSHGVTSTPDEFIGVLNRNSKLRTLNSPPWYYEQIDLGYNYRITDIQCAIGISQLKKLSLFAKRRREIVNRYNQAFNSLDNVKTPFEASYCNSNLHLYVLLFDFKEIGIERAQFMVELKRRGIQTQVHYIPVHVQPFFMERFGTKWGDCHNAERYYQKCLSLPLYPAMTDSDIKRVVNDVKRIVSSAKRTTLTASSV